MRLLTRFFGMPLLCVAAVLAVSCSKEETKEDGNGGANGGGNGGGSGASGVSVSGSAGGHDYVDLGLKSGTLWATCNVGAKKPEEYGGYYAWGETETKEVYKHDNYIWEEIQRNDAWIEKGVTDKWYVLVAKYDAATANWANGWRMPTWDEMKELWALDSYWTSVNGVNGYMVVGKNGNRMFLPASGYSAGINKEEWGWNDVGTGGYYWSSTGGKYEGQIRGMYFSVKAKPRYTDRSGNWGMSVRAVRRK